MGADGRMEPFRMSQVLAAVTEISGSFGAFCTNRGDFQRQLWVPCARSLRSFVATIQFSKWQTAGSTAHFLLAAWPTRGLLDSGCNHNLDAVACFWLLLPPPATVVFHLASR